MHFLGERFPKGVHDIYKKKKKLSTTALKEEYKIEPLEWERHADKKQQRGVEGGGDRR